MTAARDEGVWYILFTPSYFFFSLEFVFGPAVDYTKYSILFLVEVLVEVILSSIQDAGRHR